MDLIHKHYIEAKERYAAFGVDADEAVRLLAAKPFSIHCWQADDVGGFEMENAVLDGGGILVSGNYPGKARNIGELRQDLEKVLSLVPGEHRISLHASYGDFKGHFIDRDQIRMEDFKSWTDWAKLHHSGLDFNSTFFSHPKAEDGYTLAHPDKGIREFWIEHGRRCREIAAFIGKELNNRCIHNIWIPDGSKDLTTMRFSYRMQLMHSLDELLRTSYPPEYLLDTVEGKLFGIGSEAFTVGSYDFYLGYAISRNTGLCLDIGHFHPTESVADKISSVLQFVDEVLLHITRGIHWDSDHIVLMNDPVVELMQEVVWSGAMDRICFGLDYFDASVNRVGAYVIGIRAAQKALLSALLSPLQKVRNCEDERQYFERLALLEEAKTLPLGDVWNYYCSLNNVPPAEKYIADVKRYERDVLDNRK